MFAATILFLTQIAGLVPAFISLGADVAPLVTFITTEIARIKNGGKASDAEIAQLDALGVATDAALAAAVADNAARAAAGEGQSAPPPAP